jgi:hypothetical protein
VIMSKNNKKKNSLPTTADLFQGMRSAVALSAIFRNGGGTHKDKRDKKSHKSEWRREDW